MVLRTKKKQNLMHFKIKINTFILFVIFAITSCNGKNLKNQEYNADKNQKTEISNSENDSIEKISELYDIIEFYATKLQEYKEINNNYVDWKFYKNNDFDVSLNEIKFSQEKWETLEYGNRYAKEKFIPKIKNKIISDIENIEWNLFICGEEQGFNKIIIRTNTTQDNCDFDSSELEIYLSKMFNLKLSKVEKDDLSFTNNIYISNNANFSQLIFEVSNNSFGIGCSTKIIVKIKNTK